MKILNKYNLELNYKFLYSSGILSRSINKAMNLFHQFLVKLIDDQLTEQQLFNVPKCLLSLPFLRQTMFNSQVDSLILIMMIELIGVN